MPGLIPRAAARVHSGLGAAARRLTTGHGILVAATDERLTRPRRARQPAAEPPETAPDKTAKKPAAAPKKTAEKPAAAPKKTAEESKTAAKKPTPKEGKETKEKEQDPPPPHTRYRPGPRRALAATWHWTTSGEGPWDFLFRAGLLAAALGAAAYFTRPLLADLHPAALCTIATAVVVYEISPRLSALLTIGLGTALIHPVWLCITLVILLAVEIAPTLAALLTLGLAAALIHPALMWPVILAWGAAAWQAGAPDEKPATVAVEPPAETPRTHLVRWLDDLTRGTSGIHLDQLHAALLAHPDLTSLTRRQMRAWLNRHEITVDRTLRVGNIPGRSGIARTTVEALLSAPSQAPSTEAPSPAGSDVESTPLHASDLQESPNSPGVESGVESGVEPQPAPSSRAVGAVA